MEDIIHASNVERVDIQQKIVNKKEVKIKGRLGLSKSLTESLDTKKSLEVKVSQIPATNSSSVRKRTTKDQEFTNEPAVGIHTLCIINGLKLTALVDPGAMISFID